METGVGLNIISDSAEPCFSPPEPDEEALCDVSPGCKMIICLTCQRLGGSLRATLSSFCGSYHLLGKSCRPCSLGVGTLCPGRAGLQHNEGVTLVPG